MDIDDIIIADPSIKVAQGCSDDDLRAVYNSMDIFVSFAPEGFGCMDHESMACGVPGVMGDWTARKDWAAGAYEPVRVGAWNLCLKSGIVRPLPDMDDALTKTVEMIDHPNLRRRMAARGLKRAQQLNWDDIAKTWEKMIDEEIAQAPETGRLIQL